MIKGIIKVLSSTYEINVPKTKLNKWYGGYCIKTSGVGSVVRQIINKMKKDGNVYFTKMWLKTETYSGGTSINVYLYESDDHSYEVIKSLVNMFQYGNFNPMIDLYEYKSSKLFLELESGEKVVVSSKYNMTYNKPPYGTKEYEELDNG